MTIDVYVLAVMQNNTEVSQVNIDKMVAEYGKGATLAKLSVKYDIGLSKVRRYLKEAGVTIRRKGRSDPHAAARLLEMKTLYENGATLQEIGDQFSLSRERIRQILSNGGVQSLGRRERIPRDITEEEKAIAEAYDRGEKPSVLLEKHNLTYANLQVVLRKAGVSQKPRGYFNRREDYEHIAAGVVRDYLNGVDTGDIAETYGLCGRTEIYKFLNREGITPRKRIKT